MVITKSQFGPQPLSDGRDLLLHVLPDGYSEWQPSIYIKEVILKLPAFIKSVVSQKQLTKSIGKYHPGQIYDVNMWQGSFGAFSYQCIEQFNERVLVKNDTGGQHQTMRKKSFELIFVVTPRHVLALRVDTKNRSTARLNGWANIHSIHKVKHGVDD